MIHQQDHIRGKAEAKVYGTAASPLELPKYRIPRSSSDPRATLELLRDELFLDGNAKQNLATFCQTYEDAEIRELMDLCIDKNMIDKDEYPQTAEIEGRCIHMLANLWNGPEGANTLGTSTVGSSEACMLGGWPCITGGRSGASGRARTPAGPIWSPARCRCAGRSSPGTGTLSCGRSPWRRAATA